ncbi:conjugal transfer protein TraE [Lonepinella sp. BR2882]|uniref:VirB4 family type IV secretion/conjugal transfer ATPase n=1 Tax=Lonepinella sp. BR2882 TaxID=3095283 RepID=UPI003F6DDDA0
MQIENLKRSKAIESLLPQYRLNINDYVITVGGDKLLFTVELSGISFTSVSDDELGTYFTSLDDFFLNLGKEYGGNLAVWTHIVKKRDKLEQKYKFDSKFIQEFTDVYLSSFKSANFFKTSYYITFVLKYSDLNDGLANCESILSQANTLINRYDGRVLELVDINESVSICQNNEFLSFLLNGTYSTITLNENEVLDSICNSDLFFNYDYFEIRDKSSRNSKFGTAYLLKGYPASTPLGMWDFLLELPYEFVLSQSFIFTTAQKAIRNIEIQENKMSSAGDSATYQLEELNMARAYLSSGEIAFGDYQASILIFGETEKNALDNGSKVISAFTDRGKGARWSKAALESIFAFLSVMPDSKYRPLSSVRASTNLVCGFSLHNYFGGKPSGNPIGDGSAIMPLKTPTQGLYYLNTHYTPLKVNAQGEFIAGHFLILGATGTGKTTLEAIIVAFLMRFNPQLFVMDYKRSTELYMRAYGASYFTFESGVNTGLNPFQLEEEPSSMLMQFLYSWVNSCARDHNGLISDDDRMLAKEAVDTVMKLSLPKRRFSSLLQSVPRGTPLYTRLRKWCHAENGELAWVVDSPENLFNPHDFDKIGFDTTTFLETAGHEGTEPLFAVLLFYKDLMKKSGRLLLSIVEEFYIPCNYPTTEQMMKRTLKTGRLTGEFLGLVSQSPADAIRSNIFEPIMEQTSTKIMLPNPDAEYDGSYEHVGLSRKDFYLLKALDRESRKFLVKQSGSTTLAHFDLSHCKAFLPILSASKLGQQECEKIRAVHGENPDVWIPLFLDRMEEIKREKEAIKAISTQFNIN